MTHDENRISDLIDGGLHDKSAIDRAKYELHLRRRAAIEEAAKNDTGGWYEQQAFIRGAQHVIENPERYCLTQIPHWNIGPEMPDYDGDYLCVIVRENECGTQSIFYSVIECRMNKWVILDDRTSVSKWMPLPEIHTINEVGKQ